MPEISALTDYVEGRKEITRETMRQKLGIVLGCLGAQSVLPIWDEPAYLHVPSRLQPWAFEMIIGTSLTISMPDGKTNVRKTLAVLMGRLQEKLLSAREDDTKSFFSLIAIWDALIMTKYRGRDFESHWKNFHLVKKVLSDSLRGGKRHLRPLLIDRVMLHQEFRTESRSFTFTDTHRHILHCLYALCTSYYSEVRIRAQKKLFAAVSTFPYAYTALTPLLMRTLEVDTHARHEEFKGCLYVLLGPKNTPLIARHDWSFVQDIWPRLLKANPSEKPSVIGLVTLLVDAVHKHFPTISIRLQIPDRCIESAQAYGGEQITPTEVQEGVVELLRKSDVSERIYYDVLNTLYESLASGQLHWRQHTMAVSFVRDLVHPDCKYGTNIVRYMLQALVHDSLEIRKLAIRCVIFILKQQKRKHVKDDVDPRAIAGGGDKDSENGPGIRPDNLWVQYDGATKPMTADAWNEQRFVHEQYRGFYLWPPTVKVYAPSDKQPSLDRSTEDLSEQEREV